MADKTIGWQFANSITRFIESKMRNTNCDATIVSVDETKFSCIVKVKGVKIYDVPLRVLLSNTASFVEIPKVDSNCTLGFLDNNMARPTIIKVDICDKILIKIGESTLSITDGVFLLNAGNSSLEMKNNEISFNGGSNGGLAVVANLVTKYNALENDLNNLKAIFSTLWVPVPSDGGAALKAAAAVWAAQLLTPTVAANIKEDKVKH